MSMLRKLVALIACLITSAVAEDQCSKSNCTCTYDESTESATKSEVLAATIGVLSPLLLSGAVFGIYKYFSGNSLSSKSGLKRSSSEVSEDSFEENSNKSTSKSKRLITPDDESSRRGSMDSNLGLLNRRGSSGTVLSVIDQESDYDSGSLRSTSLSGIIDDRPTTPSGIYPKLPRRLPPTAKPVFY